MSAPSVPANLAHLLADPEVEATYTIVWRAAREGGTPGQLRTLERLIVGLRWKARQARGERP